MIHPDNYQYQYNRKKQGTETGRNKNETDTSDQLYPEVSAIVRHQAGLLAYSRI